MQKFIAQHKILTTLLLIVFLILIIAAVCLGYLWNKLGLIQYHDGTTSGQSQSETEIQDFEDISPVLSESDIAGLEEVTEEPTLPEIAPTDDSSVLNILLIGTDEHTKSFSENARSDSMILVSINKTTKAIKLVSLERGIGVPVLEGPYTGQYDWLTHIFRYGGADLLLKTVQTCFSVDIDYYVRVNFQSVISSIDAIGGVDVELTQAEADYLNAPEQIPLWQGADHQIFSAGLTHMDGISALTYARIRAIDNDWVRVTRQRKVIIAAFEKLKASGFTGLDELANQVFPLVQTNLTKLELLELILTAPTYMNSTIEQMTLPQKGTYGTMRGMGGRSLFAVDFEAAAETLHQYLYGDSVTS